MENEISERLKTIIDEKAGGSVSRFAKDAGLSAPTLYKYLQGRQPNVETLAAIRITYGVNLNWMVTGEGGSREGDPPAPIKPPPPDPYIMQRVIEAVERQIQEKHRPIPADKKAALIVFMYRQAIGDTADALKTIFDIIE